MTNPPPLPSFNTELERREWLIANATHFSVVRKANRKTYKIIASSLPVAECIANQVVLLHPHARLMIYAVYGVSDVWVMNVFGNGNKAKTTQSSLGLSQSKIHSPKKRH